MTDLNTIMLALQIGTLAAVVYIVKILVMLNSKVDQLVGRGGK